MTPEKQPIYPAPSKGPLADDQSEYQKEIKRSGMGDQDLWQLIVIVSIIVVGLAAAYLFFYAGFGQYLNNR